MKPILRYLKDFFASKRILSDEKLEGLVGADRELQALITHKKVPGLAISVWHKGKPFFQKGYGYANMEQKTPVDPEKTIFRIASVSKPIAATALTIMVAEKRIDLDASFYDYVPYYPKKKFDFTLRQLASHTAGIRGYRGKEYALNIPYSIKDSIAVFKEDELLFPPDTGYHYNSFDWVLISLAMQEVSGIPFESYVADKVLEPLKMKATSTEQAADIETEMATFYSNGNLGFRKAVLVHNFYKLAGGGYVSTASDIALLGQAYLDKRIAVPEEIIKEFLSARTINDASTYYGLGWQVSNDASGRSYYGHIGNGVGGYSNFFVYPNEEMVISILINCTDPKVQDNLDVVVDKLIKAGVKENT